MSVLIVGAGPVGLMMAAELRRHGIDNRIVERRESAAPYCKALGITPRTLEVWDDLGIVQPALAAGLSLHGSISITNGDLANGTVTGNHLPDGAYGFLALAQYDVERILAECLDSLGGRAERNIELVEVEQNDDVVRATLRHAGGGTEAVECQYLIACDGGRSTVRHALNLPFEGEHFEQTFMLADIEWDWDLPRGYSYRFARVEGGRIVGGAVAIPVPGNSRRYRISTIAPEAIIPPNLAAAAGPPHGVSEVGPTLQQVQHLVSLMLADTEAGATKVGEMRWSSFYRISHRLAARYRNGRVFLAGDAAHLHPPLGGQGLNTGVQDAYNLAWKLALDIKGRAAAGLLDSYEAERRAAAVALVERTTGRMKRMLAGEGDEQSPLRDDSQLFLNYRQSPISLADAAPASLQAGDRAPDVPGLRHANVRHDNRLFDLLRGPRHALVLYTNHPRAELDCRRFIEQMTPVAASLGARMLAIIHPDCALPVVEGLPIFVDSRNDFARTYGGRSGSVDVIRPDGYLGCRATSDKAELVAAYAGKIIRLAAG